MSRCCILVLALALSASAADFTADSTHGARLFETLACVQCHSIFGQEGKTGSDLGRLVDRDFTPSSLAATMWNHAPAMWAAMHEREIHPGDLDERAARDLFAYFYSARFFEKPGDAGRGKRAFNDRGCVNCHGLTEFVKPLIKPVNRWEVLTDPIALAEVMWNHRAWMLEQAGADHVRWPQLSSQDLSDILVYLRNLPSPPSRPAVFVLGAGHDGEAVFNSKGCSECHTSGFSLVNRIKGETLTQIAVAMWNHAPAMAATGAKPVKFEPAEMRDLLSYLWARQFFEDAGNVKAGLRVFAGKHCASCHEKASSGAPKLTGRQADFTSATMISALWRHGPPMLEQMKAQGIAWPRFEGKEMSDLIAYLNSK